MSQEFTRATPRPRKSALVASALSCTCAVAAIPAVSVATTADDDAAPTVEAAPEQQSAHSRVMSANMKGGLNPNGNRHDLIRADRAMNRAITTAKRQGVRIIGTQEYSLLQHRTARKRQQWGSIRATPNDRRGTGQGLVAQGNGIVFHKPTWRFVGKRDLDLDIKSGKQGPRTLHMLVATFRHQQTDRPIRVLSVHLPHGHGSLAVEDRARGIAKIRTFLSHRKATPVALTADFNMKGALPAWTGMRNNVDAALFRGCHHDRPRLHSGFKTKKLSDHKAVSIRFRVCPPRGN